MRLQFFLNCTTKGRVVWNVSVWKMKIGSQKVALAQSIPEQHLQRLLFYTIFVFHNRCTVDSSHCEGVLLMTRQQLNLVGKRWKNAIATFRQMQFPYGSYNLILVLMDLKWRMGPPQQANLIALKPCIALKKIVSSATVGVGRWHHQMVFLTAQK